MVPMIRVGAVQAEPVWLDLQGGVDKTVALIEDAGRKGINVLGFPDVWIPGYPWAIWTASPISNTDLIHDYMANSLRHDSEEMCRIKAAVKAAGVFVVLGHSERDGGSLYIAQSFISPAGHIMLHRRKIKPTHVERALWGEGQADSLQTVVDSPFGKIGGLNCWEHLQPLLRYHEYTQGVQIHVASWPPMYPLPEEDDVKWGFGATDKGSLIASQFLAIEGQCFVLVATQVLAKGDLKRLNLVGSKMCQIPGGGFSMIFGPDGRQLVDTLPSGEEGILQADINLRDIDYAKAMSDPVGHYSRPDLLSLSVNTNAAKVVTKMDS